MTGEKPLSLHPMKKIEIVVNGDQSAFVQDLMARAKVTGYTMVRDIAGMGRHGFHEGRLLFNDIESLVMYIAVAPEATVENLMAGLRPLFEKQSGVMFVSDVSVVRLQKFTGEG